MITEEQLKEWEELATNPKYDEQGYFEPFHEWVLLLIAEIRLLKIELFLRKLDKILGEK